ncbi:MAG: AraC family transcriptional regulator [Lachnospiraceae bacterium]|jgi:AraC-like DNA-binding protein|nr:AraC family transcriptional regulator [Lachnospiraceae bacterium]
MADVNYEKTGYLHDPFRLFHLTDRQVKNYDCHYHDFHKILLFFSGDVDYFIEGITYRLEPRDILLIGAGDVHRPIIRSAAPYERIILYVSSDFLVSCADDKYSLETCFQKQLPIRSSGRTDIPQDKKTEPFPVLRTSSASVPALFKLCEKLEASLSDREYAAELYSRTLLLQFLIQLNRSFLTDSFRYIETGSSNRKITEILHYINEHLDSDLSIDALSRQFFISRRYLMQIFQQETGYSIGKYINAKRLFWARDKIRHGMSLTDACFSSGFHHYSTFTRSYYRMFRTTPGTLKKEL